MKLGGVQTKDLQASFTATANPHSHRRGYRQLVREGSYVEGWSESLHICHSLATGLRLVISFLPGFCKNCSVYLAGLLRGYGGNTFWTED